ncbi:NAD(P)H-binding protein [Spirosoma sp. SC4-14]|uniref:NAD(P)H-binding protein n=1 Tax=Spirosoma sp. SC4-14 TaxID=3128900 RepID=UPI0030D51C72
MSKETIAIIGCGWVGLPLAEQLVQNGYRVIGSTTSVEKIDLLQKKAIVAYQLQLNPEPIGDLDALLEANTLIIDIPPKAARLGNDFHPRQIRAVANAVRQSPISHVIYVSSTSVYPELNRVLVEDDVFAPEQSASPAMTKAEELVRELSQSVTIVRCGGLMGYDRIPGKYVAGKTVDSGAVPVNYLHRDDAVGILQRVVREKISGVFNAVAPEHPSREAIYRKSCADFGYAMPTFVEPDKPVNYKIISSDKLIELAHYQFLYPNPLQFYYTV